MDDVRLFFRSLNLLGGYHVSSLDARHILVRCALSHDLNRIRRHGTYYVNNKPLRMWKWEFDFRPGHESPITPIWIAFPVLPVEFWGGLKSFASVFGKPIQLDKATSDLTRPFVARVLVEFDARKSYPNDIFISLDGKAGFKQSMFIEKMPFYCPHCYKLGHSFQLCYFKHPKLRPKDKGVPNTNFPDEG
ncbi:hypothetical protein AXF42_Ash007578 [Apostasia shenzhenica]|uniref:Uncharacterized protein n=1 Tax=Apostasia shenzhenica TaxID=1088818 RepID=A0A2I0A5W3_9ASPA|nr:hypothetical protein AXF42_Ash007578 [Apostasia shenzhenica]